MESEVPPTESTAPVAPAPAAPESAAPESAAPESAHDRHTREFNRSLETLEDSVEHGVVRALKIAVAAMMGLFVAAIGMYVLGNRLRDRSERKRVARAIRHAHAARGHRPDVVPAAS